MDAQSDETTLGISAEDFYESRKAGRNGPVQLALRLAAISSPSTFPPEDWQAGDPLPQTNQSVNADCLNTLASKIMLGAMPPGLAGWKASPEEHRLDPDFQSDPKLYAQVVYALARRTETHRERMEATQLRSAVTLYYKLLLLTGSALILWTDIDHPVVYNMHHYVVKRDASGVPLVIVLKTNVSRMAADEDVVEAYDALRDADNKSTASDDWDDDIAVYHVQKLVNHRGKRKYLYWQELEGGHVVDGTDALTDFDTPTMYAGGMIPEYGSDWYIPYCADYEGDMMAVENYSAALQDGGAAAARFVTLVDPSGQTDIRDVEEAENLAVIPGREQDVKTLRADKGGDLAVTANECREASRRLGKAFLLYSSVQRNGERVTAEEWKLLATEIEQAMGGLYSSLSQTSQRYFVMRFIMLHEATDKRLGKLPEGLVRVTVVTGIDSLGQSSEEANLREFVTEAGAALQNPALEKYLDMSDYLTRLAAIKNVKAEGLVKGADRMAQEQADQQNQSMQQTLLDKATSPLAKGGVDAISKMMESGQIPEGMIPNG